MVPRILVVDDEPDIQALVKRRFRQQIRRGEFEFDFALDGRDALDRIERDGDFDIVLSDINMPRMDGLTLLGHLRQYGSAMKTIIVSAYGDMENIRTAMNRGAFDFVTKPINFDDLSTTIEKSLEELTQLRRLMARMTSAETAKRNMARELEIGRRIQGGFLPRAIPAVDGWSLVPCFRSAREVAGDFYDVFTIDGHDRIGLIVADVCDKGVGAALFMTLFRSLLRSTVKRHEFAGIGEGGGIEPLEQPDLLLRRGVQFTNNYIARTHGHTSMFATLFFGLLDPRSGHLYYINAGHEAPLIVTSGEISRELENTGPVVGLFEGADYGVDETLLAPGDTLFAYTDGVTDVVNGDEEPFTLDRLRALVASQAGQGLTQAVIDELDCHRDGAPQFDDITMLSVTRK